MVKYNEKIFDFGVTYTAPGNGREACSILPKGKDGKREYQEKDKHKHLHK